MYCFSKRWKLMGIVGLCILALALTLGCTGPAGPAGATGPAGPAGPEGPAAPAGSIPVVLASPSSVEARPDGTVGFAGVTFTGAGWSEDTSVYVELLLPDGTTQMLVGGITENDAFMGTPTPRTSLELAAGTYTVRATGGESGAIAYAPITVTAAATE